MIFYDFEVFAKDWLVVFIDTDKREKVTVVNDPDRLKEYYEENVYKIWCGYNNRHYDQYIMKGILLGMDPKRINDYIINGGEGWNYSRAFNSIPMINYDVMPNPPISLKTLEGFMGSDIRETEVAFDLNRSLTMEEIDQSSYYCTHDVEETVKVFMEKIDEYNAMLGILAAFPDIVNLSDIGSSEARITAKVLGCNKQEWGDEFAYSFLPCLRLKKYTRKNIPSQVAQ